MPLIVLIITIAVRDNAIEVDVAGGRDRLETQAVSSCPRGCSMEYHPNKVAVLWRELRELTERKTKQINEAFRVIKDFRIHAKKSAA
jgi:preprotein translocase subunit Sec63